MPHSILLLTNFTILNYISLSDFQLVTLSLFTIQHHAQSCSTKRLAKNHYNQYLLVIFYLLVSKVKENSIELLELFIHLLLVREFNFPTLSYHSALSTTFISKRNRRPLSWLNATFYQRIHTRILITNNCTLICFPGINPGIRPLCHVSIYLVESVICNLMDWLHVTCCNVVIYKWVQRPEFIMLV